MPPGVYLLPSWLPLVVRESGMMSIFTMHAVILSITVLIRKEGGGGYWVGKYFGGEHHRGALGEHS